MENICKVRDRKWDNLNKERKRNEDFSRELNVRRKGGRFWMNGWRKKRNCN